MIINTNNLINTNNNATNSFNRDFSKPRTNFNLNPWNITGFVDAEGSFSCSIFKTGLTGVRVKLEFKVVQKSHSEGILYEIKEFFGCGNVVIDNRTSNTKKYHVTSIDSILNIIIPPQAFDKFPCLTSKYLNFQDWREIALILKTKNHLNNEGLDKINSILSKMNTNRSFEDKYCYLFSKFYNDTAFNINPHWLQGFIDGEGTFYNYISNQENKTGLTDSVICDSSLEP